MSEGRGGSRRPGRRGETATNGSSPGCGRSRSPARIGARVERLSGSFSPRREPPGSATRLSDGEATPPRSKMRRLGAKRRTARTTVEARPRGAVLRTSVLREPFRDARADGVRRDKHHHAASLAPDHRTRNGANPQEGGGNYALGLQPGLAPPEREIGTGGDRRPDAPPRIVLCLEVPPASGRSALTARRWESRRPLRETTRQSSTCAARPRRATPADDARP